jgi:hypothetical protein
MWIVWLIIGAVLGVIGSAATLIWLAMSAAPYLIHEVYRE